MGAGLVDAIRRKYGDGGGYKCREHGCCIVLAGLPTHVVLKGERLVERGTSACDCIIFDARNGLTASLIEIKSSSMDADKIQKQFEGGGEKVLEMTKALGLADLPLIVALIAKKYPRTSLFDHLKRKKVKIGHKEYPIILRKCGMKLADTQQHRPALRGDHKPSNRNA